MMAGDSRVVEHDVVVRQAADRTDVISSRGQGNGTVRPRVIECPAECGSAT